MGTHWVVSYVTNDIEIYFDSPGVEYTLKEIRKFTGNNQINKNSLGCYLY